MIKAKGEDTLKVLIRGTSYNDLVRTIFEQVRVIPYEKSDRG